MMNVIMGYGGTAICPDCDGMMHLQLPLVFHYIDCNGRYQIDNEDIADKEITIRKKEAKDYGNALCV